MSFGGADLDIEFVLEDNTDLTESQKDAFKLSGKRALTSLQLIRVDPR